MSSGTKSTENAYLYGWDDENGRYSKHYYAGTQRMASRVEFMPKGMGEEPQQPSGQTEPQSQSEGIGESEGEASGQTSGQTELTDENGNASDGNANDEKQPSKEEKEAMREYQKLQQMEVAKVDASGGSESASGTEESEAVEPDLYYYHTDHLGSTTFITDRDGNVAQYLAYTPYGETFIEERNVTPYKFNGKELDAETGLYYYGARYYDPTTALWLGVDPLAEKYPGVSPYVYCMGNPVNYVDLLGEEPNEDESARMCDHSYGNKGDDILTGGWQVSKDADKNFGITLNDAKSGFKSQLYERTNKDGTIEYAYAFAGTDFTELNDWENNVQQVFGQSDQYSIAMDNADKLAEKLKGSEITFVGHSLGGGLAAACAYKTGLKAKTFNAAIVSPLTVGYNSNAKIDAYVNVRDELRWFQTLPPNGDVHWRINQASPLGHSIDNFYKPGIIKHISSFFK